MGNQGSMLSKTLVIGIIFLFIGISAFTVVGSTSVEKQGLVTQSNSNKQASTTLITDPFGNCVFEVDITGTIIWQKAGLSLPYDAERLANGNTLITKNYINRVIEVDSAGTIVWQKTGLNGPGDAERLANGNTLIAESGNNRVIEVDSGGTIVREKAGLNGPYDAERISNEPPNALTITGKTSGKAEKEYEYTFNAVDLNGDDVRYIIDWDDDTSNMTDFNPSGTDVKVKHTWGKDGTYNITAQARDIHGALGPEGKLTVTMPKNKPFNFNFYLLSWLLERFLNVFPIPR